VMPLGYICRIHGVSKYGCCENAEYADFRQSYLYFVFEDKVEKAGRIAKLKDDRVIRNLIKKAHNHQKVGNSDIYFVDGKHADIVNQVEKEMAEDKARIDEENFVYEVFLLANAISDGREKNITTCKEAVNKYIRSKKFSSDFYIKTERKLRKSLDKALDYVWNTILE